MFAIRKSTATRNYQNKRKAIADFEKIEEPTAADIKRVRRATVMDISDAL